MINPYAKFYVDSLMFDPPIAPFSVQVDRGHFLKRSFWSVFFPRSKRKLHHSNPEMKLIKKYLCFVKKVFLGGG